MLIQDAALVPDWLKDSLDKNCPYCGSPYHVGYSPSGTRVTRHYCPNDECSETITMKMVFMWTVLGVEGIKAGNSRKIVKSDKLTHHLEALPIVLTDIPEMDLATYMRINCIHGIDSEWENVCNDKSSLEEVLSTSFVQSNMNEKEISKCREYSKYVKFFIHEKQEFEPVLRMTVMMTGNIMGLANREDLIPALNLKYKGLLDLRYSRSLRKTGISALIMETGSQVTGKVNTAKEYGIPIRTPLEFITNIDKLIRERTENKYDF